MFISVSMNDFLGYVRKRRAELQKELNELEIAERIYRESGVQMMPEGQHHLFMPVKPFRPPSMKEMVKEILDEMYPHGLTARELLNQIGTRWNAEIKRESLSPQLTRLKNENEIRNDNGVWKRVKQDASPAQADEASDELTGPGVV